MLRVKLRYLERENARRREIARLYDEGLVATPLRTPHVRAGSEHVYHQYVVRAERREDLRTFLRGRGIGTLVHCPMPAHLQPAYRGRVVIGAGGLEASEQVCEEVLSLPMYAQMADDQARMVCQAIGQWPAAEPRTL